MHPLIRYSLRLMAAIAVTLLAVAAAPSGRTHAQLSCELPPPPLDDPEFVEAVQESFWNKTDFCIFQEGVIDEIISGGVGPDGIPPIDDPTFDDIATASEWLQPQSPVIAVSWDGVARAYPLAILTRHEIVNDVIGDTPVAVTFCPLCNSAIVYDRRVDGETLRFGVSGFLRNSDLVMWDDKTQSWWQQFTGEGIVGTYTGTLLEIIPSQIVGFSAFVEQFPDGEVLSPNGRNYGSNPYTGYDSNPRPFLFAGTPDERLFPTERVLGIFLNDTPVAYPFETLAEVGVINDTIGETDVVAFWQPGAASALDGADIDSSRDVGMAGLFERELDGEILSFVLVDGAIQDEQTGSTWNIFGTAVDGPLAGSQLRQLNAFPHFWFSWAAFYPETVIYGFEEQESSNQSETGAVSAASPSRNELDPVLGAEDAPITLIEYGAYGCPSCRMLHQSGVLEQLLEEFPGQIKIIYRDFPVIYPNYDYMAAELAQCVLDQGNDLLWAYHDALFTIAQPGFSDEEALIALAGDIGADVEAVRACAASDIHLETVRYDEQRGFALGLRGTPSIVINDRVIYLTSLEQIREEVLKELDTLQQ